MEEKKLTDEEVLTAIELCFKAHLDCCKCPYFNKYGRNFCIEDNLFYKDMKRIVTEHAKQKAEIEQLTKIAEVRLQDNLDTCNLLVKAEYKNAELQKQVDELKAYAEDVYKKAVDREEDAYSLGFDNGKEQAVKDTAKEIYDFAEGFFTWDEEGFVRELKELVQNYGVEVE